MKKIWFVALLCSSAIAKGQELYVYTEPASNMPARSIGVRLTGHYVTDDNIYGRFSQRYMPEIMLGINKRLMVHISSTFSDMHTTAFRFESVSVYAKYRFLSHDDLHTHFRMAAFVDASHTRSPFHYDEITLMGDKSGVEAGLVATQLWNRFALNASLSNTQVLDRSRTDKVLYIPGRNYQSLNYTVSGGYLLLPKNYTDYRQLNLNLYAELLGQQLLDGKGYYVDIAPALQFIFNSNTKVNIGRRFQMKGDMQRMANSSWLVTLERTLLNALKKKK